MANLGNNKETGAAAQAAPVAARQMSSGGADASTAEGDRPVSSLGLGELIREITAEVTELAKKQVELSKAELKADLTKELGTVGRLSAAALAALLALNMLMVAGALGLALVMPAWAAALVVAGALLAVAGIAGALGWNKRVRHPMARTRSTLKDDLEWTKERLS